MQIADFRCSGSWFPSFMGCGYTPSFPFKVKCCPPLIVAFGEPSGPFGAIRWVARWLSSRFYRKSGSAKGMRAMVQERPGRIERRLSAILAADVAGYSRLMHNDEEATHTCLTALLADAVEPAIAEHGGHIVKNTGDGFLAEFPSAVEAVRTAMEFQNRIHELTMADAEDRRIAFRVGINIGDVIVEAHDIFGDGVNIAARLEGVAEPGGICISSAAYDQVQGKVEVEFADLGEQNLKNIARPVRAYVVVREGSSSPATPAKGARPGSPSPPRLSIVVLPFANIGGDPEQDYFVD